MSSRILKVLPTVLLFACMGLVLAVPAEARKSCWCWIGIERGQELLGYGAVESYRDTESGKKAKCSRACSARCAEDINNFGLLCSKLGPSPARPNIGCFSVVGAKDNPNNTWDYDARPAGFRGCEKICECPRGWYDKTRDSCVVGADCKVPGMPNGDKGGGYFAWDQALFIDIPGKHDCRVVPTGSGGDPQGCSWTPWLDRDNPSGTGDFETLAGFVKNGQACEAPKKIECQTLDGRPASSTGQPYTCDPKVGGVCDNRKQPGGRGCLDYRVRFCC